MKDERFLKAVPPVAAVLFTALFVSLAFWQLDRAGQKEELLSLYSNETPFLSPTDLTPISEFDRIAVSGRFAPERQVLIDNIPIEGRIGYYVITPFEPANRGPLLLVNRGWVPKPYAGQPAPDISVSGDYRDIQGLVGRLPRVAIRPGDAFVEKGDWPRTALYPTTDEVAAELGADVLPLILLLDPDADGGYMRRWQPDVSGPMTHYGYAVQWFAMAIAVIIITGWHWRKRRQKGDYL